MPYDFFPVNGCHPDSKPNKQANVDRVAYGDGYAQSTPKGVNSIVETWQVVIRPVSDQEAAAIDGFLSQRKGAVPFLWAPPGSGVKQWTCAQWSLPYINRGASREFTGQFVQDFSIG